MNKKQQKRKTKISGIEIYNKINKIEKVPKSTKLGTSLFISIYAYFISNCICLVSLID